MPRSILLATRNQGKAREFQQMLGSEWSILTTRDVPGLPEVVEDGDSFEANAIKKALGCAEFFPDFVLADDSGLEVDALNGAPGIYSARYAGEPADDTKNNELLLERMSGLAENQRGAQFVCCLALCQGADLLGVFTGILRGHILSSGRGSGGFGYDPLFVPENYQQSFGQLNAEIKNSISHRSKALGKLINHLTLVNYKT
jgi:XTP/dITP diphosphohydrolase